MSTLKRDDSIANGFNKILAESSKYHLLLLLQTSEDFEGNRATLGYFKGVIAAQDAKNIRKTLKNKCIKDKVRLNDKTKENDDYRDDFSDDDHVTRRSNTQAIERLANANNFGTRKRLSHHELGSNDGVSDIPPVTQGKHMLKMEISDDPTAVNHRGNEPTAAALER